MNFSSPLRSSRLCVLISATALASAAAVAADRAAAMPTAAIDAPVVLDPVVTTIGRGDEPLHVHVDPKAPAQPVPAHDGADVLKSIPGFSVVRKGGTDGDPVLRGLAGSRLGILIDGEAIFGGCGNRMDPPTAYVFPAAYDRITIVKGPQTVLHGPGNSAGVVRFERDTHRPAAREAALFASATVGGFGRFDAALDARAATPLLQARITATNTRAGDYRDGDGHAVHSSYHRWSANANAAWTPDAQTTVEFSTARSDGEAAYADRAMDGVLFDRENYGLRLERTALTPLVASIEARLFRNYVDHVMDNFSLRPFAPSAGMSGRAVSNPDRLTTGGLAQIVLTPTAPARLTVGLDTQHNAHSVRNTANETVDPFAAKSRLRDAAFRQAGLFAQGAYSLAQNRRLYAGARFDHWRATDPRAAVAISMMSTAANPSGDHTRRSGLVSGFARYEHELAGKGTTLFAGVGRLQRFPDYWEMVKNESATSVTAFGTRPETTTQIDVGMIHRRGPLQLTLATFASRIDDFILVQSNVTKMAAAPAMGGMPAMGSMPVATTRLATITRNVDATTWGGEADLGWRMTEHWRLEASLAYVHGENDTDARPLAQLPPLEGRLSFAYQRRMWSAGALVRAVAAQDRVAVDQGNIVGQDLGRTPGFGVFALHASWRVSTWARLTGGIDNVFDRTYAEHISRAGSMVTGFVQTRRVNELGRFVWVKFDVSL